MTELGLVLIYVASLWILRDLPVNFHKSVRLQRNKVHIKDITSGFYLWLEFLPNRKSNYLRAVKILRQIRTH